MQSKHLIWKKSAFFLKKALFFEVVKDYIVKLDKNAILLYIKVV